MIKSPYSTSAIAICVVLAFVGCTADDAQQPQEESRCSLEAAQKLVNKAKPTDEEAMRLTGATAVRQIKPGDMVTQDFREDRVTIETDPASGNVVAARCG